MESINLASSASLDALRRQTLPRISGGALLSRTTLPGANRAQSSGCRMNCGWEGRWTAALEFDTVGPHFTP